MLSLESGKPIAVVCGGELNDITVYVEEPDAPEEEKKVTNVDDIALSRELFVMMSPKTRARARVTLGLDDIFGSHDPDSVESGDVRELNLEDGVMIPLPSKETERVYIAGKSGSGKSTWAALYMCEYLRMFPERRIILLSRHSTEKAYQKIKHKAIPLEIFEADNKRDEAPEIAMEDIKDSLVVFDDTDNLQNKHVQNAMKRLNDDIISNGRKYNIHCLTLAHQLMNYTKTRNLLNEANKVVFFNTGAKYHIERYLKIYAGLDPKVIKKVCAIRSRWTAIAFNMPMYVLHEKGVFTIT